MSAAPLSLLVVCTGNICRSPFAERWLRNALAALPPGHAVVASAGTRALVGRPAHPGVTGLGTSARLDFRAFSARQVDPAMLRDADLVLTMTAEHRAQVLDLAPAALKRTFLLRELARLLQAAPPAGSAGAPAQEGVGRGLREAWREVAAGLAAGRRGSVPGDDVHDPYGGGPADYRLMEEQMVPALEVIGARLTALA
ncbi:low molecular weight phosphatase family protein [Sinomonas halotolerans]|uniref:Low molecular weight phosphatase family protein n=1 Tax=Sinomonas halotolerans TaxID=1644133 RepID=A0ABU9WXY0_9MICC